MGYTKIDTTEITTEELALLKEYLKENGMVLQYTAWEITVRMKDSLERVAHGAMWSTIKATTGFDDYMNTVCDQLLRLVAVTVTVTVD